MLSSLKATLLVWLIILLSMFLRVYKADYYPIHNNDDSLFHVWAGTSLYKNILKPASLSIFTQDNKSLFWYSQYNNTDVIRRFSFRLEQPYFDQPPLAMFFIGLPAQLLGYTDFVQIPQLLVRIPSLIISIFSLYFTYILAKKLFNQKAALLSLLVYGLTPYYIFSHRQPYLENFLTPVFLLALIKLINYLKKPTKASFIALILLSFISGWIKIIGFGLPLIISFWLLKNKKIKAFLKIFLTGILSFLCCLGYGLITDWQQFKFILLNQGVRGMYPSSFFHIITNPEFYEIFKDGFYILGFIMSFFLVMKAKEDKKIEFFSINFLLWLGLIILTAGVNNNSPWYRYPFLPFLSIATGYYLNLLIENPTMTSLFLILILGFTNLDLLKIKISSSSLRIIYLLTISPFLIKYLLPASKKLGIFCRFIVIILLILIFTINALIPLKIIDLKCQQDSCLIPEKIVLDLPE